MHLERCHLINDFDLSGDFGRLLGDICKAFNEHDEMIEAILCTKVETMDSCKVI